MTRADTGILNLEPDQLEAYKTGYVEDNTGTVLYQTFCRVRVSSEKNILKLKRKQLFSTIQVKKG